MVIQHNIPALNAHRFMGINNSGISGNLEKLSSGFRINRAADDAAGLAISEKMRGQIRGLAMAEQNTSHGINLIQTAEGGLSETHAILQRMRELAVQSSNGTYQDEDRIQLTKEFEALKSEVDRIAESTHYNNIKLLDGSLGGSGTANLEMKAFDKDGAEVALTDAAAVAGVQTTHAGGTFTLKADDSITINYKDANGANQTYTYVNKTGADQAAAAVVTSITGDASDAGAALNEVFTVAANATNGLSFTAKEAGANKGEVLSMSQKTSTTGAVNKFDLQSTTPAKDAGKTLALADGALTFSVNGTTYQFVQDASNLEDGNKAVFVNDITSIDSDEATIVQQLKNYGLDVTGDGAGALTFRPTSKNGNGLTFQIGANGGDDQRVSLQVNAMDSKSIGITSTEVGYSELTGASLNSASIGTIEDANAAIDIIEGASTMVSTQRAELGAMQNRLESTMNSLGIAKENLTAAESTIRDVDMAAEMMEFTKNSILVQASQAMLAQANQLPQGVLQLLR